MLTFIGVILLIFKKTRKAGVMLIAIGVVLEFFALMAAIL